ncbi:MAG: hypothetical protein A2X23_13215 [Chloroflexi bacterium GWC2_73_18]|nr:MAG: hypothetical protein A2X23_13215 [Chloroflexi bacterium GWC2_73_18]
MGPSGARWRLRLLAGGAPADGLGPPAVDGGETRRDPLIQFEELARAPLPGAQQRPPREHGCPRDEQDGDGGGEKDVHAERRC